MNKKIFGKCNNLPSHGHSYKLLVSISGDERYGMIINFNDLKEAR
jgi:6-pyruvoyl-tetrahydropterin synthase